MATVALGMVLAMTPLEAEKLAREQWFPFELAGVTDWPKFYAEKKAKEDALVKSFVKREQSMHHIEPQTPQDARALRVLQEEFDQVARLQEGEIAAEVKRVLLALQRGELDSVAEGCVMYDAKAKDRRELTLQHLRENAAKLKKLASTFDPAAPLSFEFTPPHPETGMVGQVQIAFGKKVPRPKGKGKDTFPEQPTIELWWSGLVMPDANGDRFAKPQPGAPQQGKWHFYQVIEPYSLKPTYLI